MSEFAEDRARKLNKRNWVSLVPYGLNQQHPNNYRDILESVWENRDSLGYAFRILSDGCCDGCSLGTSGMHDWTMKGIHLCAVRLQLLRLNTMPAMDARLFEDAGKLRGSLREDSCESWAACLCRWCAAKATKVSKPSPGMMHLN